MDDWIRVSADRKQVFRCMFFGTIRWPKTIGRSSLPLLNSGFTLKLRNHFTLYTVGAGGEIIENDGYMDMPEPNLWDAPDDAEHYLVRYAGYYAKYSEIIDRNELSVTISGAWTSELHLTNRFLLLKPLGYVFGSFDCQVIVLDPITVERHLIQPVPVWSVGR